jgi:hypothetical protein
MKTYLIFIDLEITSNFEDKFQEILEQAANHEVTYIPIIMESYNEVFYRNYNLRSYTGFEYKNKFDDERAIKEFIGNVFDGVKNVIRGKKEVTIVSSPEYSRAASRLEMLIKGLKLKQTVTLEKWELT